MQRKVLPALACAVTLAWAGANTLPRFNRKIPGKLRIEQALNRLTFGPRPGDAARRPQIGLKKWIDLQLHPDRIPENPVLAEKLKTLDSLTMSSEELVRNYPTPQVVQQMVGGQLPFPTDPDRQRMIRKMAAARRSQTGRRRARPACRSRWRCARRSRPEELRRLRTGTPAAAPGRPRSSARG